MQLKIHHYEDFSYIRISELPERERSEFLEWVYGQTMPIIRALDVQDAIYLWDYERWKEEKHED